MGQRLHGLQVELPAGPSTEAQELQAAKIRVWKRSTTTCAAATTTCDDGRRKCCVPLPCRCRAAAVSQLLHTSDLRPEWQGKGGLVVSALFMKNSITARKLN